MSNIRNIVRAFGGTSAFAAHFAIPRRTVEDWVAGRRSPPAWLVALLGVAAKQKGVRNV